MSSAAAFTDYMLPGDRADPTRATRRAISMASAYSRLVNPRGLEHYFYGPWNDFLSSLLYDTSTALSVIPQLMLYRLRRVLRPSDSLSIKSKPEKKAETDAVVPDFCVVSSAWNYRDGLASARLPNDWSHVQIEYTNVRAIVELKRAPSRNINDETRFIRALTLHLKDAASQAYSRAVVLFSATQHNRRIDSVLCIAAAGEWYRWCILRRDDVVFPGKFAADWVEKIQKNARLETMSSHPQESSSNDRNLGDRDAEEEEEIDYLLKDQDHAEGQGDEQDHDDKEHSTEAASIVGSDFSNDFLSDASEEPADGRNNDPDGEDDADAAIVAGGDGSDAGDSDTSDQPKVIERFLDLVHPQFQVAVADITHALPPPLFWSGNIRLGTAASNQGFYLINQFLRGLQNGPSGDDSNSE